jgi:hypothetical protein
MIREARERYDPRLYEHFEYLYDEMTRRAGLTAASGRVIPAGARRPSKQDRRRRVTGRARPVPPSVPLRKRC